MYNEIYSDLENSRVIEQNTNLEELRKNIDEYEMSSQDLIKSGGLTKTKTNIKTKREIELFENEFAPNTEISSEKKNKYQTFNRKLIGNKTQGFSFSETNQEFPRNKTIKKGIRSSFETYKEKLPTMMKNDLILPLKIEKQIRSNSSFSQINDEYIKNGQKSENLNKLREDNENLTMTNKIINKSNIELKNQIKIIEEELESGRENHFRLNEMEKIVENYKDEQEKLSNYFMLKRVRVRC